MRFVPKLLLSALLIASFGVVHPNALYAQQSPDVVADVVQKKDDTAHPALRGFAEAGMGLLFGTIAGGTSLITSLVLSPRDLKPALISSALLYPAGLAAGAILGGYLTDTQSGYWEPFVGAFVGAAIADVSAYFLAEDYPIFSAILVIALPLVTTIIAMETSHAWNDHESPSKENPMQAPKAYMPFSLGFGF